MREYLDVLYLCSRNLLYLSLHLVFPAAIKLFRQPKVRYLHYVFLEYKDIPGRKVTMNNLKGKQMRLSTYYNTTFNTIHHMVNHVHYGYLFRCQVPHAFGNLFAPAV